MTSPGDPCRCGHRYGDHALSSGYCLRLGCTCEKFFSITPAFEAAIAMLKFKIQVAACPPSIPQSVTS